MPGVAKILRPFQESFNCDELIFILCFQLGFCASDAVSGLKLVEAGVPREDLALLAVPLVPVQIIMPVVSILAMYL